LLTPEAPGTGLTTDGKAYTGDTVSLAGTAVGTFAGKDVGTGIAVTVSGNTLSGDPLGDYKLALNEQSGLSANISPKTLTVSGLSASNKSYVATPSLHDALPISLLTPEAPGTGLTTDGKAYTGDTVSLAGTAVGT